MLRHEVGVNDSQNEHLTRSPCLSFIKEAQSCEAERAEPDAKVSLSSLQSVAFYAERMRSLHECLHQCERLIGDFTAHPVSP